MSPTFSEWGCRGLTKTLVDARSCNFSTHSFKFLINETICAGNLFLPLIPEMRARLRFVNILRTFRNQVKCLHLSQDLCKRVSRNVSVVFLTQNLYHKNKHMRTVSLNAHYLVLFNNPRDVTLIATLARQMYSTNWQFAVEAFKDATSQPHSCCT